MASYKHGPPPGLGLRAGRPAGRSSLQRSGSQSVDGGPFRLCARILLERYPVHRQPGRRRARQGTIGRARARKTDRTEVRKLIVEAIAVAFGAGAAIGWIVSTIRNRPSSRNISAQATLVVSLLPDESGRLLDMGELTEAAQLVIIVTRDPRRESHR